MTVKVAADSRLRNNEIWKVDISRHLGDVNMYFRGLIGIKFKIVAFEYWDAGPEGRPLIALLPGLRDHAGRSGPQGRGAEIVLGVVSEGPEGPVNPGIADYLNGIVIVKYLTRKSGISYVLLHEFCHLFGAVDLRDRGSVMSLERPAFRIDAFTRSIMSVNRDRRFWPGENPLSSDRMAEAISIYSRRASLGKGEDDLAVCLGHLKSLLARSGIQASLR